MSEKLTLEQALSLLPHREPNEEGRVLIHTVKEAGIGLFGADWDRAEVLALLERAEAIYPTTGMARRLGNALCVHERVEGRLRRVFVEGAGEEEMR